MLGAAESHPGIVKARPLFLFFADATMSNVALPGGGVLRGERLSLLTN